MSRLFAAGILQVVGVLLSSSQCSAQVYYVKPAESPSSTCPGEPCHTLNYYAQNASSLLSGKSNVSLVFLDGLHVLTGQDLEVSDTINLTLTGLNETQSNMVDNPVVSISGDWGMAFERVNVLQIACLSIVNSHYDPRSSPNYASIDVTLTRKFTHYGVSVVLCWLSLKMTAEVQLHYSLYNSTGILLSNTDTVHQSNTSDLQVNNSMLSIVSCSFLPNSALEVVFDSKISTASRERLIWLENCTMYNMLLNMGTSLTNISLHHCYFEGCIVYVASSEILSLTNVTSRKSWFQLYGPSEVTIDSSSFKDFSNIANISPFLVDSVDVFFIGETVFAHNIGYQGGALYLVNTTLYFEEHSRLLFINNTAKNVGGAIYVDAPRATTSLILSQDGNKKCVFSLTYNVVEMHQLQSSIYFEDNVAKNGGDNIYGTSLKSDCLVSPNSSNKSYELQSDLYKFDNNSLASISSVSSDPTRVCICESGIPQCANYSYIVRQKLYTPGEKFYVSLVLVGADFGSTTGSVYALLYSQDETFKLGEGQDVYAISSTNCSIVEYSVHAQEDSGSSMLYLASDRANVLLRADSKTGADYKISASLHNYEHSGVIDINLATIPILLNVTIQNCPLGFVLDNDTFSCRCIEQFTEIGINQCIVINGTGIVYRSGKAWVSHSSASDNGVLVYKYCPYGYCNTDEIGVDLYEPDSQCAFSHSGILCGGCPSNLSLALGSSKCLPCTDDRNISLLVGFVIAGVALVLFIKLLDLTVTKGAINGLIFYANIIWIHQSIFFPYGTNSQIFKILKVFIAWLNLDLGIETCFFPGLDAYWKTWLQFIFPFYIWGLAALIIISCHFSHKVTEVFGNNLVHVLATLFLLSYVKLLRTIISSLVFALLEYPDGIRAVWLLDGNLPYLELSHSFLFVAAIFVLLMFWFPYTAMILLVPCLRKYCSISWIHKLKPFYDAHYGPLKDKHHYWIGLTLLVRVVLAVTAIALQTIDPKINLILIVALSFLLCYVVNQVYKKSYLSTLEASFLVNLTVLTCGFLYVDSHDTQVVITCVSVGISFITFLAILIAQAYSQLKLLCWCKVAEYRGYENIDSIQRAPQVPTHSIVSINDQYETTGDQLREPLLDSD